jgi:hypothetical protein
MDVITSIIILGSSVVERSTVNRLVASSNLARGVVITKLKIPNEGFSFNQQIPEFLSPIDSLETIV